MTFDECIDKALLAKKITGEARDKAVAKYANLVAEYEPTLGRDGAYVKAAEEATKFFEIEKAEAKKRKLAHIKAVARIANDFTKFKGQDWGEAAQALIEYDPRAPFANYRGLHEVVHGQLHSMLTALTEKYGPGEFLGRLTQRKAGLDNIIDELFDKTTGDADAAAIAKAWKETTRFALMRFNRAGGSMADLDIWRLPQEQSGVKLHKAGVDQWVNDWLEWNDWSKTRTSEGALVPLEKRREFLAAAYETLRSDGANKMQPGSTGRRSLGNKIDQHRVLHLKDADAWKAMHAKYGEGSVFDVMVGHVDYMAHNVAMIETFGPNPAAAADTIRAMVRKHASDVDTAGGSKRYESDAVDNALYKFDKMFAVINRQNSMLPENQWASMLAGTRNLLSSALLSSASLSAIPGDLANMRFIANTLGLREAKLMRRYVSMLNPANPADRRMAARMGFINDNVTGIAIAHKRYMDLDGMRPGWTREVSDFLFRATLMSPHTQAARYAFNTEFVGLMTDKAIDGVAYADLPFRRVWEENGLTEADWAKYAASETKDLGDGVVFKDPRELDDYRLGDRIMMMVADQGRRAVPDATIRASVTLKGDTRPGSVPGELLRGVSMFKNFPISIYNIIVRNAMAEPTAGGRAAYLAKFLAYSTLAGAISYQVREIANGRDPMPMVNMQDQRKTLAFWGNAMLKGGGLGIYGDFLFGDLNRYGGGLGQTLAGPLPQFGQDILNLTVGNGLELLNGKDTNFTKEAARFVRTYIPKPFYLRAVMDRMILDELTKLADPDAVAAMRRAQEKVKKERDQGTWWEPGKPLPSRPPRFDLVRTQ